jgi:hypothetical protein
MSRLWLSGRRCTSGLALAVWLTSSACPEQVPGEDAKAPCKEVGQRCEFAPGKLGSCVLVDGCRGPSCFVCQSQH